MNTVQGITIMGISMGQQPIQHLSAEQMVELVERGQHHKNYSVYIDHIVDCPVCRETYKQLLEAEAVVKAARSHRRVMGWRWASVVAASAAVLILVVWLSIPRPVPSWQESLRLVDGVAYEGSVRLPEWLGDARALYESPPTVTRSAAENPVQITLLMPDPANEGLETQTPHFEWRPLSGATRYFALLEPLSSAHPPITLRVEGTKAFLPAGVLLTRGERYRLRLSAMAPSDTLTDEGAAVYEFRVLTEEELAHLRWARQNGSRAPYASALTFYQLGFYREAFTLLHDRSNDPTTQKWLQALEEAIRQRGGVP